MVCQMEIPSVSVTACSAAAGGRTSANSITGIHPRDNCSLSATATPSAAAPSPNAANALLLPAPDRIPSKTLFAGLSESLTLLGSSAGQGHRPALPPPLDPEPPLLSTTAEKTFTLAYINSVPEESMTPMHKKTFLECHEDESPFRGDIRWKQLYAHPLFVSCIHWLGANIVSRFRPGANEQTVFAINNDVPLSKLLRPLEKRFERLLRWELARFWDEAHRETENPDPTVLQTVDNLALQWTLMAAMIFMHMIMARTAAARSFAKQLAAMFRVVRVPGEAGLPKLSGKLDDWLLEQHFIGVFWITVSAELAFAAGISQESLLDPLKEFPTVPLVAPNVAIAGLPSSSERELDMMVPEETKKWCFPYTCRDIFAFIDPDSVSDAHGNLPTPTNTTEVTSTDPQFRDSMLDILIGDVKHLGTMYLNTIQSFLRFKVSEFAVYLKTQAGLSLLDVLLAEDLVKKGDDNQAAFQRLGLETGIAPGYLAIIFANDKLKEAVRRRGVLREASEAILRSVPPDLASACLSSDFNRFQIAVQGWLSPAGQQQLLGYLALMRKISMLIGSPEPFEDMKDAGGRGGGGNGKGGERRRVDSGVSEGSTIDEEEEDEGEDDESEDGSEEEHPDIFDAKLQLWFSSSSFFEASKNAMVISANMRMLLDNYTPEQLQTSMFTSIACIAATYAAWLNLLVLRRFRSMVASASAVEQARALELYDAIKRDVRSCLALLDSAGTEQHHAVKVLLESALDGTETKLSSADVQMLRLAKKVAVGAGASCSHLTEGEAESGGHCWICATEKTEEGSTGKKGRRKSPNRESDGKGSSDTAVTGVEVRGEEPLASLPTLDVPSRQTTLDRIRRGSNYKRMKRVTFAEEIAKVGETWSKEEYPARSMHAQDLHVEEEEEEDEDDHVVSDDSSDDEDEDEEEEQAHAITPAEGHGHGLGWGMERNKVQSEEENTWWAGERGKVLFGGSVGSTSMAIGNTLGRMMAQRDEQQPDLKSFWNSE